MERIKDITLSGEISRRLLEIERFQGTWQGKRRLERSLVSGLKRTTIITSSGASTRIEGALLTDPEVSELIEKGCKITQTSSRSEREVAGYVKALNFIYDNYQSIDISEHAIRELHQLMTSELLESQLPKKQRGVYKDITNDVEERDAETGRVLRVWFKTTPPGPQTQAAMRDLIENFRSLSYTESVPSLVLIGAFIVHFLAIHPFRDGNGRLSRLITVLLLLKNDYDWVQYVSHEKVIEDNKEGYYVSLRNTQGTFSKNKHDYRPWISFFLMILRQQTKVLDEKLRQTEGAPSLNKRESSVYQLIKQNPDCSIGFLLERVDMSRGGLKTLMSRLIDKGYVEITGERKGAKYTVL